MSNTDDFNMEADSQPNDLDLNYILDMNERGPEYAERRYQAAKAIRKELERPEGWRSKLENPNKIRTPMSNTTNDASRIEDKILFEIIRELGKAEAKFPLWPEDIIHADAIINEEKGELTRAVIQYSYEIGDLSEIRKEAIQTAAMCIRFLKRLDTYKAIKTLK